MKKLALFAIGLVFGGGIGFLVAASQGVTLDGHDHGDNAQHGQTAEHAAMGHSSHDETVEFESHDQLELSMDVTPDSMSGYNLHFKSGGFDFAPENAGMDHVAGQGHAHLYVNGVKIARLYGQWVHIASLPKGNAEVVLTLTTNDHRTLTADGEPISLTAIVPVK